jgi:hypothetical protein
MRTRGTLRRPRWGETVEFPSKISAPTSPRIRLAPPPDVRPASRRERPVLPEPVAVAPASSAPESVVTTKSAMGLQTREVKMVW